MACRAEGYPGVTGHPQLVKKSFQWHKIIKISLLKFLARPKGKKIKKLLSNEGYAGLTPSVLDSIWSGVRSGSMSVTAADTMVNALRRAVSSMSVDSFHHVVNHYLSDSFYGMTTTSFQVRESVVTFLLRCTKRCHDNYVKLHEKSAQESSSSSSSDSDSDRDSEEKKKEREREKKKKEEEEEEKKTRAGKGGDAFKELEQARHSWIMCMDRMFELCFPTVNTDIHHSVSISCVDTSVQSVVDKEFLGAIDVWDHDQEMVSMYLSRMVGLVSRINHNAAAAAENDGESSGSVQLDALRALSGLMKLLPLYTAGTNKQLSSSALFSLLLDLSQKAATTHILERLLNAAANISSLTDSPNKKNIVRLTCTQLDALRSSLLAMEKDDSGSGSGGGGGGSGGGSTAISRLGVVWKWLKQGIAAVGSGSAPLDPVVLISSEELVDMYRRIIVPTMASKTLQGNGLTDARNLCSAFWVALRQVNIVTGKIQSPSNYSNIYTYSGFNELDGISW